MSKGQVQLLRAVLRAGGDASRLPLEKVRRNFDLLLSRFPGVEDLECEPASWPSADLDWPPESAPPAEWIDARADRSRPAERLILYLHGGGFVLGSIHSHRHLIARLSRAADARCLAVAYRKAPEHPFPAALNDTLNAFHQLLEPILGDRPWAIAGDSAGAGLGILAACRFRDRGQTPAALVCFSPWTDYEGTGESLERNAELDPVVQKTGLAKMARLYLGDRDPWDPELCPLTADLTDLPPMLIQVGGVETLLDDSLRLHRRARELGVDCELQEWPDMIHVWQLFAGRLDEGEQAIEAAGRWLRQRVD